jgi:hypothetical protein
LALEIGGAGVFNLKGGGVGTVGLVTMDYKCSGTIRKGGLK